MFYGLFMRAAFITAILAMSFSTSFAVERMSSAASMAPDKGTYKILKVPAQDTCSQLCKEDLDQGIMCRGSQTITMTMTDGYGNSETTYECHLNNGLSKESEFYVKEPESWTLQQAVDDLNVYRSQNGLGPVTLNTKLIAASEVHSKDLALFGNAAHEGSDGSTHSDRIQRQGYYFQIAGENVATGQKSWDKVFQAWKDSPGHNENLLLAEATEFGIALVFEPTTTYTTYWTMLMAAPQPNFSHPENAFTSEQLELMKLSQ